MDIKCAGCNCRWRSNHGVADSNEFHGELIECPMCIFEVEDKE